MNFRVCLWNRLVQVRSLRREKDLLMMNNLICVWKGLDMFGDVYEKVDWDKGPSGVYFHKFCHVHLRDERRLNFAIGRATPDTPSIEEDKPSVAIPVTDPPRRGSFTRSKGVLHKKDLCVWCMKASYRREPFRIIETEAAWNRFKNHTVYIDDHELRERLVRLIDCTPDPFATEIYYHNSCMKHYFRPTYDLSDPRTINIHNGSLTEIRQLFFTYVRNTILKDNEQII